jgi:hypothetical protein
MSGNKNSTQIRYNVDVLAHKDELESAAIEDSVATGQLYSIANYTREILAQFVAIRRYQRDNGLPLSTPAEIADMMINSSLVTA